MQPRRIVRITDTFEADLDRQLPEERTGTGTPSRLDFLLYDMPLIVETFAGGFDQLAHIVGAPPNVRSLIGQGTYVPLYFVAGRLTEDAIIELQAIDIELDPTGLADD